MLAAVLLLASVAFMASIEAVVAVALFDFLLLLAAPLMAIVATIVARSRRASLRWPLAALAADGVGLVAFALLWRYSDRFVDLLVG